MDEMPKIGKDLRSEIESARFQVQLYEGREKTVRGKREELRRALESGGVAGLSDRVLEESVKRLGKMLEETIKSREDAERRLAEALAKLEVPRCMQCNVFPVDDGVGICEECAYECAGEVERRNRESKLALVGNEDALKRAGLKVANSFSREFGDENTQ